MPFWKRHSKQLRVPLPLAAESARRILCFMRAAHCGCGTLTLVLVTLRHYTITRGAECNVFHSIRMTPLYFTRPNGKFIDLLFILAGADMLYARIKTLIMFIFAIISSASRNFPFITSIAINWTHIHFGFDAIVIVCVCITDCVHCTVQYYRVLQGTRIYSLLQTWHGPTFEQILLVLLASALLFHYSICFVNLCASTEV